MPGTLVYPPIKPNPGMTLSYSLHLAEHLLNSYNTRLVTFRCYRFGCTDNIIRHPF